MRKPTSTVFCIASAVLFGLASGPLKAQDAAEFYKGKQVQLYVGVSPGGIYSTFALMLSHAMGKHIPGNPSIVVQHMRGAGGTKALNYVNNVAPQDGSVIMTPNAGVAMRVLLKIGKPKYDPAKLQWLGGWGEAVNTVTLRSDAPVKTLKEAMSTQVVLGSIGKSSNTFMIPSLMNNTIGTKFKLITGYRGGSPIRKAIESKELDGWAGQWLGWKLRKADWIRDGKIVTLVQMASQRDPDLPNVPLLTEFAKDDEQREMFEFVQTAIADKGFMVAPRVPADRASALEKAYWDTLHDKTFLAEMTKRKYRVDPIPRARIQAWVEKVMNTPPEKIARLRELMGLSKKM